jgi:hypothetical protein
MSESMGTPSGDLVAAARALFVGGERLWRCIEIALLWCLSSEELTEVLKVVEEAHGATRRHVIQGREPQSACDARTHTVCRKDAEKGRRDKWLDPLDASTPQYYTHSQALVHIHGHVVDRRGSLPKVETDNPSYCLKDSYVGNKHMSLPASSRHPPKKSKDRQWPIKFQEGRARASKCS